MSEWIEAHGAVLALAVLLVVLVGWWLLRQGSTVQRRDHRPDVLDEGQAPAARNQALIDAPPAATIVPPPMAGTLAGVGEIVAVAAQDNLEEAQDTPPPAPAPAAPPSAGDDLSKIKGVGPKLQALLPTLGLATYAQIAALDEAGLDALDAKLGTFAGRPRRDSWVEQARFLAAGDAAGFEGKFGKL